MSNSKRIVIVGGQGQVGWELRRTLAPLGQIIVMGRANADYRIELADPDSITAALAQAAPDIIVNAAAYTAVDKAEAEQETCAAINATAPGIMAEFAKKNRALLVHYSTDYVFDGGSKHAYTENDATNPLNVYGKTKLAGEQAITAIHPDHLIFRTSWIYSNRGKNFLRTILKLANERDELGIVDDQTGSPTWSRMLAETTALIINKCADYPEVRRSVSGLYHTTCTGKTTWYGFAKEILELSGLSYKAVLKPITTGQYPLPARRPQYSVMSNKKLTEVFGVSLPSWEDALSLCLQERTP